MKKFFLGAVVFGALVLTSCKKDYECTFTTPAILEMGIPSQTYSEDFNDVKKSDAEDLEKECENGGGTWKEK